MSLRLLSILMLLALLTGACKEVDRIADVAPRLVTRGSAPALQAGPAPLPGRAPLPLPAAIPTEGYEFTPMGVNSEGWPQFHVRIESGGSPFLVAVQKFTPLFQVDGKLSLIHI